MTTQLRACHFMLPGLHTLRLDGSFARTCLTRFTGSSPQIRTQFIPARFASLIPSFPQDSCRQPTAKTSTNPGVGCVRQLQGHPWRSSTANPWMLRPPNVRKFIDNHSALNLSSPKKYINAVRTSTTRRRCRKLLWGIFYLALCIRRDDFIANQHRGHVRHPMLAVGQL